MARASSAQLYATLRYLSGSFTFFTWASSWSPSSTVRRKSATGNASAPSKSTSALAIERVLLVEDLTTDGRSKVNFCNALRGAGAIVEHIFVVFFYGIYPESKKIISDLGVTLHHLATWWDVLEFAKSCGQFDPIKLQEIEKFLHDPAGWSKANGGVSVAAE